MRPEGRAPGGMAPGRTATLVGALCLLLCRVRAGVQRPAAGVEFCIGTLHARKATKSEILRRADEVVSVIRPGPSDVATARLLEDAYGAMYEEEIRLDALGRSDAAWRQRNAAEGREFAELFAPSGLDPADNELAALPAVALLRQLGLDGRDTFIDLGSSRGKLVFAAAAASGAGQSIGVELSKLRHGVAQRALERFEGAFPAPAAAVRFLQGDLRTAPLDEGSVLYCGVRGPARRPELLRGVVEKALRGAPAGGSKRILCAGFAIEGEAARGVELRRAYVFQDAEGDPESFLPLYGDGKGPRVITEYVLRC